MSNQATTPSNKSALITGASRGIGKAIALEFAKAGYDVIITSSKSKEALNDVQSDILRYGVRCMVCTSDVSSYTDTQKLFDQIFKFTHCLDTVINNAGISYIGLLSDMDKTTWDKVVGTNLNSLFHTCKFAVPHMVHNKSGQIINISSVWGHSGASCEVAYSATKGALNTFTKALAKELAPSNIRVNAIAAGAIDTTMNSWLDEGERLELIDEIDLGRLGSPEEIAQAALFLASKKASYITGQILTIDGGFAG